MQYNVILFAAILPAFLLVVYIYICDRYQREPLSQIIRAVLYGVLSVGIALALEVFVGAIGLCPEPHSLLSAFWKAFVGAAIPEEGAKLLMLYLLLRNNKYFDERIDGIVYACCVSMGFAGTENIVYLFDNLDSWSSVAISRAMFAVPGHFLFAVAMGYFYSQIYFRDMSFRRKSLVLLAPVLLHGCYDGFLFAAQVVSAGLSALLLLCFYVFCFLMFVGGRKRIRRQVAESAPDIIRFF